MIVQVSEIYWHAGTFCESDGDKDLNLAAGAASPRGDSACDYHGHAFAWTAEQDYKAEACQGECTPKAPRRWLTCLIHPYQAFLKTLQSLT
jgi:hypothetical protein